jgi:hypothetical protein
MAFTKCLHIVRARLSVVFFCALASLSVMEQIEKKTYGVILTGSAGRAIEVSVTVNRSRAPARCGHWTSHLPQE